MMAYASFIEEEFLCLWGIITYRDEYLLHKLDMGEWYQTIRSLVFNAEHGRTV